MPDTDSHLQVEVVYALAGNAHMVPLRVAAGTTIRQAIEQSGIRQRCPEIDLEKNMVGIFSKVQQLDDRLNDGDRIEIYRSLLVDPKQARRHRAEKQKAQKD